MSTIIIYVSDVFSMHVMYVWAVYNTHIAFVYEPQFIVYCRGLLMGLASIAVAVNHRRHTIAKADNKGVLADIIRIFLYLVIMIGSCILAWLLIVSCLDRRSLMIIASAHCRINSRMDARAFSSRNPATSMARVFS